MLVIVHWCNAATNDHIFCFLYFLNWFSLHVRLNNHYKARSSRKKTKRRRKGTRRKRRKCLMLILMLSCLFSHSLTIVRALSKVSFSRKRLFLIKVFMKKKVSPNHQDLSVNAQCECKMNLKSQINSTQKKVKKVIYKKHRRRSSLPHLHIHRHQTHKHTPPVCPLQHFSKLFVFNERNTVKKYCHK